MYIYDTNSDFFLQNATLLKIVFCYLYIEITFSYIYFLFSNHYQILQIFLLYSVIFLYFIIHLKAMNFLI